MATFTAILDACVLYPAPLRDLLLNLACLGLFRARWTSEIHEEWIRNLLRDRPDPTPSQLQRTRDLMDRIVRFPTASSPATSKSPGATLGVRTLGL